MRHALVAVNRTDRVKVPLIGKTLTTEVNFLVPKLCRNNEKIPFQTKISDLQKWANWPAQAGSKKWAENKENCRMKRNFPILKKLAELTSKKLTSGQEIMQWSRN